MVIPCPECRGSKTVSAMVGGVLTQCKCGECAGAGTVSSDDYTPCDKCGQIDQGQTGEYPCEVCGLPILHDEREKV